MPENTGNGPRGGGNSKKPGAPRGSGAAHTGKPRGMGGAAKRTGGYGKANNDGARTTGNVSREGMNAAKKPGTPANSDNRSFQPGGSARFGADKPRKPGFPPRGDARAERKKDGVQRPRGTAPGGFQRNTKPGFPPRGDVQAEREKDGVQRPRGNTAPGGFQRTTKPGFPPRDAQGEREKDAIPRPQGSFAPGGAHRTSKPGEAARIHTDKARKPDQRPAHGDESAVRKPFPPAREFTRAEAPARKPFGDREANRTGDGTRLNTKPRGTARDTALKALQDVAANGAFAAQALDRQLNATALLPDDKRLATSIFYAAVENRIRISYILKSFVKTTLPEIYDVLHIACAQLLYMDRVPDHAVVDEAVKQARAIKGQHVSGFVNGVLRNVIRARDAGTLPVPDVEDTTEAASVEHSVTPELMERLTAAFGEEEAARICAYRPEKHTQTIRPNLMTTTDEELGMYLHARNIEWTAGDVPHAFLCNNPGALASLDGYHKGIYSLQGEGSMLAAYAAEAKPGMNILDACAAPGGKSALLCELMNGTGRVYAWDVHEHRVELIRAAGRRLRLYNLRPSVRDARTPYEPFEAFMDAVLVDAPCSGLGVLADKPDIRLRFKSADVDDLVRLQREILEQCAKYVRVGGLLVYATCTILPEENEAQVREFLKHNPQFAPETADNWLPERLRPLLKDGMVQFFQHRDNIEGFFIARMRRKFL